MVHTPKRLLLVQIQYMRGIAAMMVVLHHVWRDKSGLFAPLDKTDLGRPGVLIFFVISGFIMMHSCRTEPPLVFARRRIIRVAPLYVVMTLIYFSIIVQDDVARGVPFDRLPELLASLSFIPHYHAIVTDKIWPILVPGWTLNYEMFFFMVFAIGIASGRVRWVAPILLCGLVALGLLFPMQTDARFVTWTNPFLLLFVAGIGLAIAWERMRFDRLWIFLPIGFAIIFMAAPEWKFIGYTELMFFIAAVCVIVGTLGTQHRWPDLRIPLLKVLGDASYSIYLSHTIFLIFIRKALAMLPLSGWAQVWVTGIVATTVSIALGVLVYRYIEKPMLTAMRRRSEPRGDLDQGRDLLVAGK